MKGLEVEQEVVPEEGCRSNCMKISYFPDCGMILGNILSWTVTLQRTRDS
jgi:hypothetical protein